MNKPAKKVFEFTYRSRLTVHGVGGTLTQRIADISLDAARAQLHARAIEPIEVVGHREVVESAVKPTGFGIRQRGETDLWHLTVDGIGVAHYKLTGTREQAQAWADALNTTRAK